MLRLMQKKALSLAVKGEDEIIVLEADSEPKTSVTEVEDSESNSKVVVALGSRGVRIRERLEKELNPVVELEVEDVSHQHAGHAAVRGSSADGETHFNLRVVSDAFKGKSLVKRHRMVYDLLQEELESGFLERARQVNRVREYLRLHMAKFKQLGSQHPRKVRGEVSGYGQVCIARITASKGGVFLFICI
ncbi:hypothetical protein Bca4012_015228 [Brassica carinata]